MYCVSKKVYPPHSNDTQIVVDSDTSMLSVPSVSILKRGKQREAFAMTEWYG